MFVCVAQYWTVLAVVILSEGVYTTIRPKKFAYRKSGFSRLKWELSARGLLHPTRCKFSKEQPRRIGNQHAYFVQ